MLESSRNRPCHPCSVDKKVFLETGPSRCQKGWGPLPKTQAGRNTCCRPKGPFLCVFPIGVQKFRTAASTPAGFPRLSGPTWPPLATQGQAWGLQETELSVRGLVSPLEMAQPTRVNYKDFLIMAPFLTQPACTDPGPSGPFSFLLLGGLPQLY